MTKTCEECSKPFTATTGKNWDRRRFCCRNCKTRARRRERQAELKAAAGSESKACKTCGKAFYRRDVRPQDWSRKTCCSAECQRAARNAARVIEVPVTKPCQACGQSFTKPPEMGNGVWVTVKYCSEPCLRSSKSQRDNARRRTKRAQSKPRPVKPKNEPTFDPRDTYRRQGLQPLEAIPAHLKAVDLKDAFRMAIHRHGDEFLHALGDAERVKRESPAKPFTTKAGARYLT